MAVLKIYQSQIKPNEINVPQIGALAISQNVATNLSKGYGSIGDALKDIYNTQKDEEDKNKATDIFTKVIAPEISKNYSTYSKSTNINEGINGFNDALNLKNFDAILSGESRGVKKLIEKKVNSERASLTLQLGNKIVANSIERSEINKKNELDNIVKKLTSNNSVEVMIADREYKQFFQDPANISFYGAKKITEEKQKRDKEIFTLRLIRRTENGGVDLTDEKTRQEILSNYNPQEGKSILKKIQTIQVSKYNFQEAQRMLEEKKDIRGKVENFAFLLNQINDANSNPTNAEMRAKLPTLDGLNDLKNLGSINKVQYEYLLNIYTNPQKLSENAVVDSINAQLALAKTIDDVDQLQNSINLDDRIVKNISPEDLITYNGIIDKFKKERNFGKDYSYHLELLKIHTKEVANAWGGKAFGENEQKDKINATNRLREYNEYIYKDNLNPQDAYLKTIQNISSKDLPSLIDMPLRKELNLQDRKEFFKTEPKEAFNKIREISATQFKNKQITIEQFKKDISDLDFIEDVYNIRLQIFSKDEKNPDPVQSALSNDLRKKPNKK